MENNTDDIKALALNNAVVIMDDTVGSPKCENNLIDNFTK
jgi:hypothetical protein